MILDVVKKKIAYLKKFKELYDNTVVDNSFESKAVKLFKQYELNHLYSEMAIILPFLREIKSEFDEEMTEFFEKIKPNLYKRKFYIKDDEIKESVVGFEQEEIEKLKSNPMIESIKEILEKIK